MSIKSMSAIRIAVSEAIPIAKAIGIPRAANTKNVITIVAIITDPNDLPTFP